MIGIGAEDTVLLFAAQYQDGTQLTHGLQRPANGGATHAQKLRNPANSGKGPLHIARLLEQAQAYAETRCESGSS